MWGIPAVFALSCVLTKSSYSCELVLVLARGLVVLVVSGSVLVDVALLELNTTVIVLLK